MEQAISLTALRKQLGEALRPIRLALHSKDDGSHQPVEFMGYRFTGSRCYKAPGQSGYVWKAYYSGAPADDWTRARWPTTAYGPIGGTLDECAAQMHSRLRKEAKAEGVAQ
jgi:hypothetical protein